MKLARLKRKARLGSETVLANSQMEAGPYEVMVCDRIFRVKPGVFSPKYFLDTEFFAQNIHITPGERFCEIGPGTGAICITKALEGASRVVAIDVNPLAVELTRENAEVHGVRNIVTVFEGNVYEPLVGYHQFDCIFWNVPFCYVDEDEPLSTLQRAICDPGYLGLEQYIRGARGHLKPGGRLMIGFSRTIGHGKVVEQLLEEDGFDFREIATTNSCQVEACKFNLFEARLRAD